MQKRTEEIEKRKRELVLCWSCRQDQKRWKAESDISRKNVLLIRDVN